MGIADIAHRCVIARSVALAEYPPVSVRSGQGWFAVRSGAKSNELNVVVSEASFVPSAHLVDDLTRWFGELPVSWLTEQPEAALTSVLSGATWTPERTGRWCGRPLVPIQTSFGDLEITTVRADSGLDDWLDVASACGWFDDSADRDVRRELMVAMVVDPRRGAWLASLENRPVGMATGWCAGGAVELVDVAVRVDFRRRGAGTELIARVMAWGAARGAREVVAAPSPDGWRLLRSLGFDNVGVVPDTCFYLSARGVMRS